MRYLKLFCIFLILMGSSITAFAQNNNIGFNISMNDISGLNAELRYEKYIGQRWLIGSSVASNFHTSFSVSTGFKYDLLRSVHFSLLTGMDYKFESIRIREIETRTKRHNSLEVPLEFRYYFSNRMSLNAGFSIPFSLDKGRQDEYLFNNYKIGVIRRF